MIELIENLRRTRILTRANAAEHTAAVLAALGLFAWMALSAAEGKSPVFDEPPHLAAGAAVWLTGDYRLLPESGVLVERWLGLPVLLWRPHISALTGTDWQRSDVWKVGDSFLYDSSNDADLLVWRARVLAITLAAAMGLVVFLWSRRINGILGGWVSLALFVFCPTLLAQGPLATADVPAALLFTVATWAVWRLVHRVSPLTLLSTAAAVGALLLSKFSGPIIVFVAAGVVFVQLLRGTPIALAVFGGRSTIEGRWRLLGTFLVTAALVATMVGAIVWGAYGYRYRAFSTETGGVEAAFQTPWTELVDPATAIGRTLLWTRDRHVLPEAFVYGLAHTLKYSEERPAFLNGRFETTGSVQFFPYAFLVKTTIPLLMLAIGGVLATMRVPPRSVTQATAPASERHRGDAVPLGILFGVYALFALSSHLNIGHRYLLPLYPPLLILAGGVSQWWERPNDIRTAAEATAAKRRRKPRLRGSTTAGATRSRVIIGGTLVACVLWHAGESWHARPDYLAYVNELAGGLDNGYLHLVDSSVDWGQDLPGLKRWLNSHPENRPVYLSYFGSVPSEAYGITAVALPSLLDREDGGLPEILRGGTYCVSVTMLQGVYLAAPGPWTEAYETQYQHLWQNVRLFEATAPNSPQRAAAERVFGASGWSQMFRLFEQFRAARLFAYLRRRRPDANIDHSILVFRLSDDDAATAQLGPSPS